MRRAVILATLTCILFAVAGVTAATENSFTSSSQDGDQTESTVPEPRGLERTAPEATALEATVPEATVPEDVEKPDEGTVGDRRGARRTEGVWQERPRRGELRWDAGR